MRADAFLHFQIEMAQQHFVVLKVDLIDHRHALLAGLHRLAILRKHVANGDGGEFAGKGYRGIRVRSGPSGYIVWV